MMDELEEAGSQPDLLSELRSLGQPREDQSPQAEPPVGVSETARQLDGEGYFDSLARQFGHEREQRTRQTLEDSQGWSESGAMRAVRDFFNRPEGQGHGPRSRRAVDAFEQWGRLAPDERQAAAQSELETAERTATSARGRADAIPQVPVDLRGPGLMVPRTILNVTRGLLNADAVKQETRLARAQAMVRGEAELPQYAEWRALTETGAKTVADMFTTLPIQYAGIIGGYALGTYNTGNLEFQDNRLYKFGQQVERAVQAAFPNDPARQFEYSHTLVQGLASTMAFGGQGAIAHLLGAGPRGQLALIALSGMAAQTPPEFARVTEALEKGDATERDRIIAVLANSALGATEAAPFANTIAGPGRGLVGRIARGGEQAVEEMGQEALQQTGQNLTRMLTYDPKQDPYEGVLESMVVAAISGFGYGAAFSGGGRQQAEPTPVVQARAGARTQTDQVSPAPPQAPAEQPAAPTNIPQNIPGAVPEPAQPSQGPSDPYGLERFAVEPLPEQPDTAAPVPETETPVQSDALGRIAAMADRPEDSASRGPVVLPPEVLEYLRETNPELAQRYDKPETAGTAPEAGSAPLLPEEQAAPIPTLRERLEALNRGRQEDAAQLAQVDAIVAQNLPAYRTEIGGVLSRLNVTAPLSDTDVRAVARHMARDNLTAEEALERYAIEAYETERQQRGEPETFGLGLAGTEASGGHARQQAGAAPQPQASAAPAGGAGRQSAGARSSRAGDAQLGAGGDRAGTSTAAQRSGEPQRGVREDAGGRDRAADGAGQNTGPTRQQREFFNRLLKQKKPLKWSEVETRLRASPEQMEALREEALSEGLLRRDRHGVYRRTRKVAMQGSAGLPSLADLGPGALAIPVDVRIDNAVRIREAQTGVAVSPVVRDYAIRLLSELGTPAFTPVFNRIKANKSLSTAHVRDLAALAGYPPNARTSKADAYRLITQRHADHKAFLARQGRAQVLAAFATAAAEGQAQRADLDALGFFSQALEAAKTLKQAKGTPEQMRAMLRAAGVKEAELQAVEFDQFLDGKKSVTRDEIVSFLENNRVEVRESRYGTPAPDSLLTAIQAEAGRAPSVAVRNELLELASALRGNEFTITDLVHGRNAESADLLPETREALNRIESDLQIEKGLPKWASYSLDPSNPTYRETVIHLHLPREAEVRKRHFAALQANRQERERLHAAGLAASDEMTRLIQEEQRLVLPRATFQSGHWSEPNIIAHARTSLQKDAADKTVFLIDELQSDWGQKLREGGVRDEAKIAELEKQLQAAQKRVATAWGDRKYPAGNINKDTLEHAVWLLPLEEQRAIPDLQAASNDVSRLKAELATAKASTPGHPLVNTTDQWVTTALRRLVAQAVAAGADKIAFTPGKVQAERFNVGHVVDRLVWQHQSGFEGERGQLSAFQGDRRVFSSVMSLDELPGHVGKEMAERLLAQPAVDASSMPNSQTFRPGEFYRRTLSNLKEVEVGGQGMRATYDGIYPRALLKILQKMDKSVKQGSESLHSSVDGHEFFYNESMIDEETRSEDIDPILFHTFPLTPKVKASVQDVGQSLFSFAPAAPQTLAAFARSLPTSSEPSGPVQLASMMGDDETQQAYWDALAQAAYIAEVRRSQSEQPSASRPNQPSALESEAGDLLVAAQDLAESLAGQPPEVIAAAMTEAFGAPVTAEQVLTGETWWSLPENNIRTSWKDRLGADGVAELARLWAGKTPVADIAKRFGEIVGEPSMPESAVRAFAARNRRLFPIRRGGSPSALDELTTAQHAEFRRLWLAPATTREQIAAFLTKVTGLPVSEKAIGRFAARNREQFPPRQSAGRGRRTRDGWRTPGDTQYDEMVRLWDAGASVKAMVAYLKKQGFEAATDAVVANFVRRNRDAFPPRSGTAGTDDVRSALAFPQGERAVVGEAVARRSADIAIRQGRTVTIPSAVVSAIHSALIPMQGMVPPGYGVAAVSSIEPVAGTEDVILTLERTDGGAGLMQLPWSFVRGARAFHVGDNLLGDPKVIVALRFVLPAQSAPFLSGQVGSAVGSFDQSLRGELAHEIVHAVARDWSPDLSLSILRHANSLRVMDMTAYDHLMAVGREDLAVRVADPNVTVLESYLAEYTNLPDSSKVPLILEEEAAHMVELAFHGWVKPESLAPVAQDLERAMPGIMDAIALNQKGEAQALFAFASGAPARSLGIPASADPPISSYTKDADIKAHVDYKAAKGGDVAAAVRLVRDMVQPDTLAEAWRRFGSDVIYVPVIAEEATGRNKIPEVLARYYASMTGAAAADDIIQSSRSFHTGARPLERLIARPVFEGDVVRGGRYVLVDDVSVMGGTLAELAEFLQVNGAEVVGSALLVNAARTGVYNAGPARIRQIEERYGDVVREEFGIEPTALTAPEAGYIGNFRDADGLRKAIAKARGERDQRLLAKGLREPEAGARGSGVDQGTDETNKGGPGNEGLLAFQGQRRPYTPAFQSRLPDVAAAIQRELERMVPLDVPVRMMDRLMVGPAAADERVQIFPSGRMLLEVALSGGPEKARLKGFHGVTHILRESGLWSEAEWRLLVERATKTGMADRLNETLMVYAGRRDTPMLEAYRDFYTRQGRALGLSEAEVAADVAEKVNQELVAALAEAWAEGTSYGARIDGLLERILRFFAAVGNALRGLGFQTAEDVFARAVSGEVARRAEGGRREPTFDPFPVKPSVEEMVLSSEEAMAALETLAALTAYHGSPHDFDAFDFSALGTGEGAHAYGYGLYFAEREGTAKWYRDKLSGGTAPLDSVVRSARVTLDGALITSPSGRRKYKFESTWMDADGVAELPHYKSLKHFERVHADAAEEADDATLTDAELLETQDDDGGLALGIRELRRLHAEGRLVWGPAEENAAAEVMTINGKPLTSRDYVFANELANQAGNLEATRDEFRKRAEQYRQFHARDMRKLWPWQRSAATAKAHRNGWLEWAAENDVLARRADDLLHDGAKVTFPEKVSGGRLYSVSINLEPEQFLDWDKPLGQQSDLVRSAFSKLNAEIPGTRLERSFDQGSAQYRQLASALSGSLKGDAAASARLHELGVKGIRYLDQGSRGKGEGTYNYVLFSDKDVVVTAKDGNPVSAEDRDDVTRSLLADQTREGFDEQGNMLLAFSPQTDARPFPLSIQGLGGSVEERVKASGGRLRTYTVQSGKPDGTGAAPDDRFAPLQPDAGQSGLQPRSEAVRADTGLTSSFIVSEQPDGSWELSFFKAGPDTPILDIVAGIEADIGKRLSPRGWLTPQGYRYWQSADPEAVKYHQNAGELFGGMYASPRAVEMAEAVYAQLSKPDGTGAAPDDPTAPLLREAMFALAPDAVNPAIANTQALQRIRDKLDAGGPARISPALTNAVLRAWGEHAAEIPAGVRAAALVRLESMEPGSGAYADTDIAARFKATDGSVLDLELKWSAVEDAAAFFHHGERAILSFAVGFPVRFRDVGAPEAWVTAQKNVPHEAGLAGGGRVVLTGAPARFVIAGRLRHEIIHAGRFLALGGADGPFAGAEWDRLVQHANSLRVLEGRQADFSRMAGDDVPLSDTTLRTAYRHYYRDVADLQENLDQEAVAFMVEAWHHGRLSQADVAPVADIINNLFPVGRGEGQTLAAFSGQSGADARQDIARVVSSLSKLKSSLPPEALSTDRSVEMFAYGGQDSVNAAFDPAQDGSPVLLAAFAGQKAKTAPLSSLNLAQSMQSKGRTPEQILKQTGWFLGPDQMWRFEIDDSAAKLVNLDSKLKAPTNTLFRSLLGKPSKDRPKWATGKVRVGTNVPLPDILSHDKLYAAYPFLRQMKASIVVGPGVPVKVEGKLVYREADGKIIYSPIAVRAKSATDVLPALMHEIQHYIQQKEGFATGSAPGRAGSFEPTLLNFASDGRQPIYVKGEQFSPTTFDAMQNERNLAPGVDWRSQIAGMTRAEEVALQLADIYESEAFKAGDLKSRSEASSLQALLMNLLRVKADDYLASYGEKEANDVMERLGFTTAQRRDMLPAVGNARASRLVTPDFGEAADEVYASARRTQAIFERWQEPKEIAPGIEVQRWSENTLSFSSGTLGQDAGYAYLDYSNGFGIIVFTEEIDPLRSRKDVRKDMSDLADAMEATVRAMNLLPTADKRLLPQHMEMRERTYLRPERPLADRDFEFWYARDPLFMFDDSRARRAELDELVKQKYGPDATIERIDSQGVMDVKTGKEQYAQVAYDTTTALEIPMPAPVPADLAAAGLDPEIWKARIGEHETPSDEEELARLLGDAERIETELEGIAGQEAAARDRYLAVERSGSSTRTAWARMNAELDALRARGGALTKERRGVEYQITTGPLRGKLSTWTLTRTNMRQAEADKYAAVAALARNEAFLQEAGKYVLKDGAVAKYADESATTLPKVKDFLREELAAGENNNLDSLGLEGIWPIVRKHSPEFKVAEDYETASGRFLEAIGEEIKRAGGLHPYLLDRYAPRKAPTLLAAFSSDDDSNRTPPYLAPPGQVAQPAAPTGGRPGEVRGLADIIADLKETLGLTTTQGRYGLTVADRAGNRRWRFRAQPNVRGQYDRDAGVARIRIATDIDAIAHEGGHHLERVFGTELDTLKQDHAEELGTPLAPNTPVPQMAAQGFSGLELDADTQGVLVEAATALRSWRLMGAERGRAKSGTRFFGRSGGPSDAAYQETAATAARTTAILERHLGKPIAQALIGDILGDARLAPGVIGQSPLRRSVQLANGTAVAEIAPEDMAAYVAERYSRSGVPQPRAAVAPSALQLSEGFAEFFRRYITDPDAVQREMPGTYTAFEEFLDAADPGLLENLEKLQLTALSADYKAYRNATAVERGVADVATMQPQTIWEQIQDWYASDNRRDRLKQWISLLGSNLSFQLIDRTNPILKTQQALLRLADANGVRDADGRPISLEPGENAHRIARLMAGADKIGHQFITHGVPDYQGLEPVGPSLHDALVEALGGASAFRWSDQAMRRFGLYLEARRAIAEWPRYQAGDIPSPPTRRSFEENWQIIQDLEKSNPSYRSAAQKVYDWQHQLLTLEFRAGKWTQEAYDELSKRKNFYVPFMRDLSDLVPTTGAPPGTQMAKRFVEGKRFQGSQRDIINPIESLVKRAYEVAASVQFNDMVKALTNLSERAGPGGAGFVERVQKEELLANNERTFERIKQAAIANGIDPADAQLIVQQMEMQFTDATVQLLWDPDNLGPNRPPVVPLWENGERKLVRLNDPIMGRRLFDALNAIGREQTNIWIKAIGYPAAVLRAGVTMHPAFVISNILADMQSAWVLTGATPVLTQAKGLYALASTNPTVNRMMRAVGITPPATAQLYSTVGGISGGQNMAALRAVNREYDLASLRQKGYHVLNVPAMAGLFTTVAGGVAGGLTGGVVGATLGASAGAMAARAMFGQGAERAFVSLTEASETATRLGVASMALKRAKRLYPNISDVDAVREAAFTARDVIDFDRSGAKAGTLLKLIPFLGANIQGVSKAYRQSLMLDGERGRINLAKAALFLRWQLTGTGAAQMHDRLSAREQQAIRDGARVWVNMMILAAIGVSIALLFKDDPEFDDVRSEVRNTHFVFKLWGTWFRVKKPFELAHPANMAEAFYEWMFRNDPRLMQRMAQSFRETHTPPVVPQTYNLITGWRTGIDPKTQRPIVHEGLARLPAPQQYGAYSSAFAIAWSQQLEKIGIKISPMVIDWTLNNELAYWGREVRVSSDYFFSNRAPQWTDVPVTGTMLNRFTVDQSRSSASVEEFWRIMGRGRGDFDQAAAGYDNLLKAGNPGAVRSYLAGLSPEERTYAVLQKHFRPADRAAHPLNRANSIYRINAAMRREMADRGLISTEGGERGSSIAMAPTMRAQVDNILGRLAAIEAWNALHDVGRPGWAAREVRDPQPILDELRAASLPAYEEMMRRRRADKVEDYADARERWSDVSSRVNEMIVDDDLLGLAWDKSFRRRRSPARRMEEDAGPRMPIVPAPGPQPMAVPF